jgi:hypothetical protein
MPLVVADMKEEPLFEAFASYATEGAEGEISFIGVPIKDQGRVIGTLTIDRERRCHPYASMDEDVPARGRRAGGARQEALTPATSDSARQGSGVSACSGS